MYTPDITKGYQLLKSMGTFINKYYPFKNFMSGVTHAYELVAEQLEAYALEAGSKRYFNSCEEEHMDRHYRIDMPNRTTFLTANLSDFVADEPAYFIDSPVSDDISLPSFRLEDNIVSIEYLTDKIISPTFTLYDTTDYIIENNHLLLKDPSITNTFLWGNNVRFNYNYFYDVLGFLFFNVKNTNRHLALLLLDMLRYGMTKYKLLKFLTVFFGYPHLLEEEKILQAYPGVVVTDKRAYSIEGSCILGINCIYEALTPLTDSIRIVDAKDIDYFVKDGQTITHELTSVENTWGQGLYSYGLWGGAPYVIDEYDVQLQNNVVYVAEVDASNAIMPISNLTELEKAMPPWLHLNILVKKELSETYSSYTDTASCIQTIRGEEFYSDLVDGAFTYERWGDSAWDSSSYLDKAYNNEIRLYKQYHD